MVWLTSRAPLRHQTCLTELHLSPLPALEGAALSCTATFSTCQRVSHLGRFTSELAKDFCFSSSDSLNGCDVDAAAHGDLYS